MTSILTPSTSRLKLPTTTKASRISVASTAFKLPKATGTQRTVSNPTVGSAIKSIEEEGSDEDDFEFVERELLGTERRKKVRDLQIAAAAGANTGKKEKSSLLGGLIPKRASLLPSPSKKSYNVTTPNIGPPSKPPPSPTPSARSNLIPSMDYSSSSSTNLKPPRTLHKRTSAENLAVFPPKTFIDEDVTVRISTTPTSTPPGPPPPSVHPQASSKVIAQTKLGLPRPRASIVPRASSGTSSLPQPPSITGSISSTISKSTNSRSQTKATTPTSSTTTRLVAPKTLRTVSGSSAITITQKDAEPPKRRPQKSRVAGNAARRESVIEVGRKRRSMMFNGTTGGGNVRLEDGKENAPEPERRPKIATKASSNLRDLVEQMELSKSQNRTSLFNMGPPNTLNNRPSSIFSLGPPPNEDHYNFITARPDSLFRHSLMRTPSPPTSPPLLPTIPSQYMQPSTTTSRGFSDADLVSPGAISPNTAEMMMAELSLSLSTPPMANETFQKMTGDLLNLTVSRPTATAGDKTPGASSRRRKSVRPAESPIPESESDVPSPTVLQNPGGIAGGRLRSPTAEAHAKSRKSILKRRTIVSPRQSMHSDGSRQSKVISPRQSVTSMISVSDTSERHSLFTSEGMEIVSPVQPVSMGMVQEGMMNRQSLYGGATLRSSVSSAVSFQPSPVPPIPSPPRVEVRVETKIIDPNPELAAENQSLKFKLSENTTKLMSIESRLSSAEAKRTSLQTRLGEVEAEKDELMDVLDKQRNALEKLREEKREREKVYWSELEARARRERYECVGKREMLQVLGFGLEHWKSRVEELVKAQGKQC